VSGGIATIKLQEWEVKGPGNCKELAGRFDYPPATQDLIDGLNKSGLIEISQLHNGLQLRARSHVGRVQIGGFSVAILPKIAGSSMLQLMRYAYGFRQLKLIRESDQLLGESGLEDLLVYRLNAEAQDILSRGLVRKYVSTSQRLATPRGRIDQNRIARDGGVYSATLPCQHFPRIENTILNQVLMAGLRLAASITRNLHLKRQARKLSGQLSERVSPIRLDRQILVQAGRHLNRLTNVYSSALSIITMLVESHGIVLEGKKTTLKLPGFLFDMNAFFQTLILRFLKENLPGVDVRSEHGLKGMLCYNLKYNPQGMSVPKPPRPDFAIIDKGNVTAILDAKYRDLWVKLLPREMLYQLVVYAISHPGLRQSSILYPTTDHSAREVRIDVSDPILGRPLGQVCLRPVILQVLEELVNSNTSAARRDRLELAIRLSKG